MTCKDCIHIDVCNEHERPMLTIDNLYELMYQEGVEKSCKHFKNKADFVEVVRCVKCEHWIYWADEKRCSCDLHHTYTIRDDYCSFGERKGGAE